MNLTTYTDYSLRVLLFLGTLEYREKTSIKEISRVFSISENHLSKIVYELGKLGLIETIRGRNGGIRLAVQPADINIGWLVRHTEENLALVECFAGGENYCIVTPVCQLKRIFSEALQAFLHVLDSYTLQDLLTNTDELKTLLLRTTDGEEST